MGLLPARFSMLLTRGGEERAVGIDQVGDFHALHVGILADMRPAPAVDPGHRHADLVVGPQDSAGRFGAGDHEVGMDAAGGGCSQSGGGKLDETAAGQSRHGEDSL